MKKKQKRNTSVKAIKKAVKTVTNLRNKINSQKLDLLQQYIEVQAQDVGLWYKPEYSAEDYLQQELRRVAWLIEEATPDQIENEIEKLRGRIP